MPKLSKKFMATVAPALGILGVTSVTAEAEVAATATEPVQPTPQPAAPALAGTGEAVTPPKVETLKLRHLKLKRQRPQKQVTLL